MCVPEWSQLQKKGNEVRIKADEMRGATQHRPHLTQKDLVVEKNNSRYFRKLCGLNTNTAAESFQESPSTSTTNSNKFPEVLWDRQLHSADVYAPNLCPDVLLCIKLVLHAENLSGSEIKKAESLIVMTEDSEQPLTFEPLLPWVHEDRVGSEGRGLSSALIHPWSSTNTQNLPSCFYFSPKHEKAALNHARGSVGFRHLAHWILECVCVCVCSNL